MRLLCTGIFLVLLIGSQFPFSETLLLAAEYSKPQGWDQLVEAARKEGKVVTYGRYGPWNREVFEIDFEKAYPGLKVKLVPGRATVSRLAAEYRASKYLVDVVISTSFIVLKPMGLFAPLKPALILPEVADASAWRDNRLWWYDAAEPYTILNFQGIAQAYMSYNTNLVDPSKIAAWKDLLKPQWKGKILSIDPRRGVTAGDLWQFIYNHPDLGPRYLERFFGEMDVTLSADNRQMGDWLGRGRFHLAVGLGSLFTAQAAAQGLPVASLVTQHFKEGATMTSSGGAIALLKHAPHPNAARLFINWVLSRDGQMAWQRRTKQNSLRIDIPKDGLRLENTPLPGQTYVFSSTEERYRGRDPVKGFIRRILGQRGK